MKDADLRLGTLRLEPTALMGVVNVTPDSFSDGGRYNTPEAAVARGLELARQGAAILDVGGESTRPGAPPVPLPEELDRVLPVIRGLTRAFRSDAPSPGNEDRTARYKPGREESASPLPGGSRAGSRSPYISIDTCKPEVARAAVAAGAEMVNDVRGLRDRQMRETVAKLEVPVVIMHMLGDPRTMQSAMEPASAYQDVVVEVREWLGQRTEEAVAAGIPRSSILVDPGLGFGKTVMQNLTLLARLGELRELGCPLLVGPSNKSFIGAVLDLPVNERLEGTLATVAACALEGVEVVRVHEVGPARRVVELAGAIRKARGSGRVGP